MSIYYKNKNGQTNKIAGHLTQRVNARWFLLERSIEDGQEYYTVPEDQTQQYFSTMMPFTIYSFGFSETNTTATPKIKYKNEVYDIADVTALQPGQLGIGQLKGVYQMFTQESDTDKTIYFIGNMHQDFDNIQSIVGKTIQLGVEGVIDEDRVVFTVQDADSYLPYRTDLREFFIAAHLPVVVPTFQSLDPTLKVAIEFGDTVYNLYNYMFGANTPLIIGDLMSVATHDTETGFFFNFKATFFENSDITGFAVIPPAINATQIEHIIEDSETIVTDLTPDKTKLSIRLAAATLARLNRTLVTPESNPPTTELVAIDTNGAQTMIELGNEFTLEDGTLKVNYSNATFVDYNKAQTLTEEQKLQARLNIGASAGSDIFDGQYENLTGKPILNTDNTATLPVNANETIDGTISLHKVSKTGKMADLQTDANHDFISTSEKSQIQTNTQNISNLTSDVANLESSKFDKTGGTISGDIIVTGTGTIQALTVETLNLTLPNATEQQPYVVVTDAQGNTLKRPISELVGDIGGSVVTVSGVRQATYEMDNKAEASALTAEVTARTNAISNLQSQITIHDSNISSLNEAINTEASTRENAINNILNNTSIIGTADGGFIAGQNSVADGKSISIGYYSSAGTSGGFTSDNVKAAIAIGPYATASYNDFTPGGVAIGALANASGQGVAIGPYTTDYGRAVSIGSGISRLSPMGGNGSVTIGYQNKVGSMLGSASLIKSHVAIGTYLQSYGQGNIAIGFSSTIGSSEANDSSTSDNIALGTQAIISDNVSRAIQLGTGTNSKSNTLQIFGDNIYNASTHTLTVEKAEINGKPVATVNTATQNHANSGVQPGWYQVANLKTQGNYDVKIKQAYNYNLPEAIHLSISINNRLSTVEPFASITQLSGINPAAFALSKIRVRGGTDEGTTYLDVYNPDKLWNTTWVDITSDSQDVVVETNSPFQFIGTENNPSGYKISSLDLVTGFNTNTPLKSDGNVIVDTRSVSSPPSYYADQQTCYEFKARDTLGLAKYMPNSDYVVLTTKKGWTGDSYIVYQEAVSAGSDAGAIDDSIVCYRYGRLNSWSEWKTVGTFLPYEYNKAISFGASGYLYIGKFPIYDTGIVVDISATTSTTYSGKLVIACQSHAIMKASVFGDYSNTVTPNIYYKKVNNTVEIYFKPQAWSKNVIHIKDCGIQGEVTHVCEKIDAIPTDATLQPENEYVEVGSNSNGTYIKYGNGIMICSGFNSSKSQYVTITLPQPYKDTNYFPIVTWVSETVRESRATYAPVIQKTSQKTTSFEVNHDNSGAQMKGQNWMTIGYWR